MHQPLDFSWNLANNSEQVQKTGVIWGRLSNSIKQTRNAAKPVIMPDPKVHAEVTKSPLTGRTNKGQKEALTAGQAAFLMCFVGTFPPW